MSEKTLGERLTAKRDALRGSGAVPAAVQAYVDAKVAEAAAESAAYVDAKVAEAITGP